MQRKPPSTNPEHVTTLESVFGWAPEPSLGVTFPQFLHLRTKDSGKTVTVTIRGPEKPDHSPGEIVSVAFPVETYWRMVRSSLRFMEQGPTPPLAQVEKA